MIITIVIALLSATVASGFCYIVTESIDEKSKNPEFVRFDIKTTFEKFYTGVGKRYLSFFAGFFIFFLILMLGMMAALIFATKFVCPLSSIGLDLDSLQLVLTNQDAMSAFASQLGRTQLIKLLELFYITNIIAPGIIAFLLMLWIPELMYTKRNVFISLFTSIKKLFSDFWNSLCIYAVIVLGHIFIAIVCALFPQTSIMLYLGSLLFIYWMIFNIYTIFLYYKSKFADDDERG